MAGVMGLAPIFSIVTGWNLDSSNSRPTDFRLLVTFCCLLITSPKWLPELDSHQHMPLQRRPNYDYSIREQRMVDRQGLAPCPTG